MTKTITIKVYRQGELLSTETFEREAGGVVKIGRLSSAHLRLDDEKVSRIHAVVELSPNGQMNIIDMGSAEGTFVNGEKINKAAVKAGDEIRVGETRLVVQGEGSQLSEEVTKVAAVPVALVRDDTVPEIAVTAQPPPEENVVQVSPMAHEAEGVAADVSFSEPSTPVAVSEEFQDAHPPLGSDPAVASPQVNKKTKKALASLAPVAPAPLSSEAPALADSRRVAFPPPKELGELDDASAPLVELLEVRKLWGGTVLEMQTFGSDIKQVLVGEKGGAHFFAPSEILPAEVFPIARLVGREATISFSAHSTGELQLADGTVTSLTEMAHSPSVGQDPEFPECRSISLPQGAVATVYFGQLGFRFRYRSKPASYVSKVSERMDYTFLNTVLLLFFVYAGMVATFQLRPKAVDTSEEELYKVPDRFVQFILTRPKQDKNDLNFLEKLKSDIDDNKMKSAERYKGAEGKMGKPGMPDTGKRSAVKAIKIDDKEIVGNKGLLSVLGAGGPQGLSTVMGGTGLGGEMEGAIGGMFGASIGDSGGFGGLGLKGTGTGGGGMGSTIGVGGLGTRGRASGNFGYGQGAAKVRTRGERDVNISVGQPIIMGSLSMEIIRQVIHSHRDQIKFCYSQELTRNPNLSGKVSIRFTISPKGYVQQATVSQTTLNNASVENCITQRIRTWKFPEPKGGGIVIVNYPFILTAGNG